MLVPERQWQGKETERELGTLQSAGSSGTGAHPAPEGVTGEGTEPGRRQQPRCKNQKTLFRKLVTAHLPTKRPLGRRE